MIYPAKFDKWLEAAGLSSADIRLSPSEGGYAIDQWPASLGKAPTPEDIEAWDPPLPPEKIDHAAEVEAAVTAAKSARTVVSTISVVEAINARVAELEKRLGL